ncbi:MAG: acyl-CoA dehydrogenase, partial [Nitriliruptorales bacterium]|nr:acyl-CoA dehydrogenase [Nitriliruptorales bacterium]
MTHYKSNLRDIEFNLFEVFRVQEYFGQGPFSHMDHDTARGVLQEVERLALNTFSDGFVEGDRTPLKLEDGNVTVPKGISKALDAYFRGGWHQMSLPEDLGGFGSTPSLTWAATAMLLGANPAALMYCAGPFFAAIAEPLVTPEQRARWVKPWVER